MSTPIDQALTTFFEAWARELARSAEMFSGATVQVTLDPAGPASAVDDEAWYAAVLDRQATSRVWVGWSADAGPLLAGAGDDALAPVDDVVDQSLQAAVQVLARAAMPGLHHRREVTGAPPPDVAGTAHVRLAGTDGAMGWMRVCWDASLSQVCAMATPAIGDEAPSPPMIPAPAGGATGQAALPERFIGVDLPVAVVLGRARLRIRDVLKLTIGSLIELDTHPGELVDVCVHGTVVARGEVVSVHGNYGVRIQEVMDPHSRMALRERTKRTGIESPGRVPVS